MGHMEVASSLSAYLGEICWILEHRCVVAWFPLDDSETSLTLTFTFQVVDTLKSPYHASLERLVSRQYVEHYNLDNTRILKTSLWYFLKFSEKIFFHKSPLIVHGHYLWLNWF